ncbi:MAG TPA: hypothetical protein VMB84_07090, partial [Stellaceae bacterium]|nr:hypothetical protein [Stellaceae bacterium]
RLVIATLPENRQRFLDSPVLARAASFAEVDLALLAAHPGTAKRVLLSRGHLVGARRAARDKALAMYLCADSLVADGALPRLIWAAEKKKAVLTVPWAIQAEPARPMLDAMRGADGALVASARAVAGLAARHPDRQYRQWEMIADGPAFDDFPYCPWWRVGDDGILVFSLWRQPALMNFAEIARHDTEGLDRWTYDGSYASRNATIEECALLRDSDEYLAAFVRPTAELEPTAEFPAQAPREAITTALKHPVTDELKRSAFGIPFRIHGDDLDEARWPQVEREAAAVVTAVKALAGDGASYEARYHTDPPWLLETIGAANLVAYQGSVYVVPARLGPVELDRTDDPESLGIGRHASIEAARADARKRADEAPQEAGPPRLLEEVGHAHLVAYDGSIFVIPTYVGAVALDELTDPASLGIERHATLTQARAAAREAPRLLEVLGRVRLIGFDRRIFLVPDHLKGVAFRRLHQPEMHGIERYRSLKRARAAALARLPWLVETVGNFNLVAFAGSVFIVPVNRGEVALESLADPERLGIARYPTLRRARKAAALRSGSGPPRLLETVGHANLVAFEGAVYVLPTALGPVDLDRLAEPRRLGIRRYRSLDRARRAAARVRG